MNLLIDTRILTEKWWNLPDGPEADKLEVQIRAAQNLQLQEVTNEID